jgi:hypothetical protein
MPNVDDTIFDFSYALVDEIIECAASWSDTKFDTSKIPEEKKDEWRDKLWHFDVSTWKPTDDDRAFPGTHYENSLANVLEYQAYELKSEIMDWMREK